MNLGMAADHLTGLLNQGYGYVQRAAPLGGGLSTALGGWRLWRCLKGADVSALGSVVLILIGTGWLESPDVDLATIEQEVMSWINQ